jgi:hypothetical protein
MSLLLATLADLHINLCKKLRMIAFIIIKKHKIAKYYEKLRKNNVNNCYNWLFENNYKAFVR